MIHNTISSPPLRCSLAGDSLVSCFVEKGDRLRSVFEGSRYSGTMIFRINLVRVTTDRSAVLLGLTQPKRAQKPCSCCSRATWPALYFQGMNQAEETEGPRSQQLVLNMQQVAGQRGCAAPRAPPAASASSASHSCPVPVTKIMWGRALCLLS